MGAVGPHFPAPASVDMAKDMEPGPDSLYGFVELHASHVLSPDIFLVEDAEGWAVGDEHIGLSRNFVPELGGVAARYCESHGRQHWRHWTSPEAETFDHDSRLFEVDGRREPGPGQLGLNCKEFVVIPCHDDLVSVRKLAEPGVKVIEFLNRGARRRKIAGVNQDLGLGHIELTMEAVRVADTHQPHGSILSFCAVRAPALQAGCRRKANFGAPNLEPRIHNPKVESGTVCNQEVTGSAGLERFG